MLNVSLTYLRGLEVAESVIEVRLVGYEFLNLNFFELKA